MELYEWLLDWMAHLFQFPQEKPGTAVVLTGGQGAGKSIVGNVLKKLLGRYHVVAEKSEHVVGRFNDHLEDCLRLQCEEAFWGGSKQAAGALKPTRLYRPRRRRICGSPRSSRRQWRRAVKQIA